MRTGISPAVVAREDTRLTRLVKLVLRDGRTFRYTEAASDVVMLTTDNVLEVYRSRPGLTVSNVRSSVDGTKQNAQLEIGYDDRFITETMVRKGDLDGATHVISVVDTSSTASGAMQIFSGNVDNVSAANSYYVTLDISDYGGATIMVGEVYSLKCRNVFGDARCKVDKDALAFTFTVTEVGIDGVHFRTDVPLAPPPEDPTTEHNEGSETYLLPGTYSFTVPPCDLFQVDIAGGGGPAGPACKYTPASLGIPAKYDSGVDIGLSGENSYFGDWITATGGEAGSPNLGKKYATYFQGYEGVGNAGAPDNLTKPGAGKPGTARYAGTALDYSNVFPEGGGNSAKATTPTTPGINFRDAEGADGGPGGRMVRTFKPGVTGQPAVGDVIEIVVGNGGNPLGGFSTKGLPGYVKISYSGNTTLVPGVFNDGDIVWLTGNNKDDVSGITTNGSGIVSVTSPPNYPIRVGDTAKFRPGCSNFADMCEQRYDNLVNMQAEPAVPTGTSTASPVTTGTLPDSTKPKRDPAVIVSGPSVGYPHA